MLTDMTAGGAIREAKKGTAELVVLAFLEDEPVGQVNGLHHGGELVITVGTLASDLENQVHLGCGAEREATTAPRPLRQGGQD